MDLLTISRTFPILDHLSEFLSDKRMLSGMRIGWHCHLTKLTALSAEALINCGTHLWLSECNPDTTDEAAVDHMRSLGASVYVGPESCAAVLAHRPRILSDTGLVLISEALATGADYLCGASEITTSGISRLRRLNDVPLPVVNINDGRLKTLIENFHGVGDSLSDALFRLTGKMWSGRKAAVVGYGRVGAGVANYLSRLTANVMIVERDPIARLAAHYDGFVLASLPDALGTCELLVTATGVESLLGAAQWNMARDGLYVFNVGHWKGEIDRDSLLDMSLSCRPISLHLEEFLLPGHNGADSRRIYLATGGSPANVVLCSGSPEPTLIHLATEILCLNYLATQDRQGVRLSGGEVDIPEEVEKQASLLALKALGLSLCPSSDGR